MFVNTGSQLCVMFCICFCFLAVVSCFVLFLFRKYLYEFVLIIILSV